MLGPSVLVTRFPKLKSVMILQAVMARTVLSRNLGQETLAESAWQCPLCDEDWDKDLWEQTSTPFVWGTASFCGNNSPANNIVMEHKSNLASGMRVPKSLPYVLPWKNNGNAQ